MKSKLTILFSILFIIGCAKSIAPPGGPVDRIPPEIILSIPESRSINVPLDSRVTIEFSEKINSQTVLKSVFITPRMIPEPEIKVSGNKITIIPRDSLQLNTTYLITLGTDIKDAHNVNLAQSFGLAFSTGDAIDSGSVSGKVYREGKPTPGINIGMFREIPEDKSSPIDSLTPDYITQSGRDGEYSFNFIPPQNYQIVAFDDRNKNRRINPDREWFGIPYQQIILDEINCNLSGIDIQIHASQDKYFSLRSVTLNQDNLLKLRFSRSLTEKEIELLFSDLSIMSGADNVEVKAYINLVPYPCPDFVLLPDSLADGEEYNLKLDRKVLDAEIHDTLRYVDFSFVSVLKEDVASPTILKSIPYAGEQNVYPGDDIIFMFSEPIEIDPAETTALLIASETDSQVVNLTPVNAFVYQYSSIPNLDFGKEYILRLIGEYIKDRSENSLSDSAVDVKFHTIGLDTLGQISGEIQYNDGALAGYPVVLTFKNTDSRKADSLFLGRGEMDYSKELLPGYYTISGFVDRNSNNVYDMGTIVPYIFSEPFTIHPDTIRVRSRFNSSGVVIEF
ncbi:MAG: Ig-like domain-containing protein [candidate division Zixibacteria bacterium]